MFVRLACRFLRGSAPTANGVAVLAALVCLACEPCEREGCDALTNRAPEQSSQTRVAGVVASESDVVGNGCQECQFAQAPLNAWVRTQTVTTDAELRQAVASRSPVAGGMSSKQGSYSLSLEAGDYLLCVQNSCFNVSVLDGRTTTLNVRLINGISSGYVGLPDDALTRADALLLPPDLNP